MERVVIYPGTFDPVTFGHLDVIERALELFDRVIVAVATKPGKKPLFPLEERLELLKKCVSKMKRVEVEPFSGLLVDYAKRKNARVLIRGLRELSDFEAEFQQATINRKLAPGIETVFVVTNPKFFYLNSTMVKEIASMHGKIECFVPKLVEAALRKKFA
ncbi:MAG: pantetheine-phosphate adenylyltransferase [archaeon]